MSVRPSSRASWTRWRQASFPTSQSKESICRSSRSGTSSGSAIFAKEMRPVVDTTWFLAMVRAAANSCPSRVWTGHPYASAHERPVSNETGRQIRGGKPPIYIPVGCWSSPERTAEQNGQVDDDRLAKMILINPALTSTDTHPPDRYRSKPERRTGRRTPTWGVAPAGHGFVSAAIGAPRPAAASSGASAAIELRATAS